MTWNISKCMNKMLLLYFQNATTLILNRLARLARSESFDDLNLKTQVLDWVSQDMNLSDRLIFEINVVVSRDSEQMVHV